MDTTRFGIIDLGGHKSVFQDNNHLLEYRTTKGKDGKRLLYVLNLNTSPMQIKVPDNWFDLIAGKAFNSKQTFQLLAFHLLQKSK